MESNDVEMGKSKPLRGTWTLAQKQRIVAESNAEGADIAEVATRNGVRRPLLMLWRRQLARAAQPAKGLAKFAAVRVNAVQTEGVIEIDMSSDCIRIRGIVDAGMLREVLAATR